MANFFRLFKSKKNSEKNKSGQTVAEKEKSAVIPVIIVVDSSESMSGERMVKVNNSLRKAIEHYDACNKDDTDGNKIRVAVLCFSSDSKWLTDGLTDPSGLQLNITADNGLHNLEKALLELESKLSRQELFSKLDFWDTPFIIFLSAGVPSSDCSAAIKKLKENKIFSSAKKKAVAIGTDVDSNVLIDLVGSSGSLTYVRSEFLIEEIITGCFCSFKLWSYAYDKDLFSPARDLSSASRCFRLDYSSDGDFDSDTVCRSTAFYGSEDFDSDIFAETCVLSESSENDFDSSDVLVAVDDRVFSNPFDENEKADTEESSLTGIDVPDGKLVSGGYYCRTCGAFVRDGDKFCPCCGALISNNNSYSSYAVVEKRRMGGTAPPRSVNSVQENIDISKIRRSAKARLKEKEKKANTKPRHTVKSAEARLSQVQFSAVVPEKIIKGEYAIIDISVYEDEYRNVVERIISNAVNEVREIIGSSTEIAKNTSIRIVLSSPDIELTDCDEAQIWKGRYLEFSFPVEIPANYAKKQIMFIATVYFNDFIATKLKFVVNCFSEREQKLELIREDVLTAFISYASQDRSRVASIIQGMQKARPDMDIFFDVESLRSGEDWEKALRREIERRDVLFLCWSEFAKNSEWVEKEWRYALTNKGLDSIEPVPLVSPAECPPPDELKSKHFNDRALLYKDL